MEIALLVILAIASAWLGFVAVYGTIIILGGGVISLLAGLLFTALVLGFLLSTWRVFQWSNTLGGTVLKLFWFIALAYAIYIAWVGNTNLIVGTSPTAAQIFVLIGLTLLMVSAPILLSWRWTRRLQASRPVT